MYLEAFKALDCLTEDTFSTSAEDIQALKNLQDDDAIYDEVDVYDVTATTPEDIEDSYIGKVILDCDTCHSLFYRTPDEIVIDEEEDVANIDEECPICASVGGYKIVGEVAPFGDFKAKSNTEAASQEMNEGIFGGKKKDTELYNQEKEQEAAEIQGRNVEARFQASKKMNEGIFSKKGQKELYTISVKEKDGKWTPVHSFDNKQDAVKFKADYEKDHPDEKYMLHTGKKFESLDLDIKDLNESIKSLSIDTDDTRMEMTSDETGKVTVTTEPIDNASDAEAESAEVIAPVSDETVEEIEADEESVDLDVDEIDEESFDDLGESLLKNNYTNVKSFKTLRVTESKDKLFIEGVIRFTSGKRGRTTFILESAKIDRNHKVQFVARNKELKEGIELPVIRGSLRNNKLIFEKFSK